MAHGGETPFEETMRTTKLLWISNLALVIGLATSGCAKDDSSDDGADTGASTGDGGTTASSMSATGASMSTTVEPGTTGVGDTTAPGTDSGPGESTGTVEPQPNGAMCSDNEACESGFCYVAGILGGLCGECLTDDDCAATTGHGCSIPNPLANPPQGALCNDGSQGAGCNSDAVCIDGNVCAEILNVPGVLSASTCSQCVDDAGCTDGTLCSPSYDVLGLSGTKDCVEPGSVPNGSGCDQNGSGDDACLSGHCAVASVMGLLDLGVCSECSADEDCPGGAPGSCVAPSVDLNTGLVAGTCM